MKKIFVALCMVAFLAACDDSSSASAENNEPTTLSSAEEQGSSSSSSFTSAGSVTLSSSSRHCEECNDEAISSSIEELNGTSSSSSEKVKPQSSFSEKFGKSSSSVIETSSSSVKSESTEKSSSSEKLSVTSSSSAGKIESSSSKSDVPQSYAEAKVMPSGTYDCTKYKCVTTEYLNQEFLEAGKYGEILDERDGQVYKTVQIGEQTWMAQNLNYAYTSVPFNVTYTYRGLVGYDVLSYTSDSTSWCYNDSAEYCTKYGRLYTWATAMDSVGTWSTNGKGCGYDKPCLPTYPVRGICPKGWHLPDTTEWNMLFIAAGGASIAGMMLKSTSVWYGGKGTDAYGFSALPAGERSDNYGSFGRYMDDGDYVNFWSSTEVNDYRACGLSLNYHNEYMVYYMEKNYYGLSVRCVKD